MAGPQYKHEYVSAAVSMGPITSGTEWSLDFWLANRGATTEYFQVGLVGGVGSPRNGRPSSARTTKSHRYRREVSVWEPRPIQVSSITSYGGLASLRRR
jgi:hypothetical protein